MKNKTSFNFVCLALLLKSMMAQHLFYLCFLIFNFILIPVLSQKLSYTNVDESDFSLSDGLEEMVFVPLEHQIYPRVRRDLSEPQMEKPRPTKKPYVFDLKQTTILADGANNKTGNKYIPKFQDEPVTPLGVLSSTTLRTWQKASGPVLLNVTLPVDTEIQITRFLDDDISNRTLYDHNITSQQEDHHVYYNSTLLSGRGWESQSRGKDYWVDIDKISGVKVSDILSSAHRRAVTVKLSFDFPFYGHIVRNMTIATGGFLYTGEYVHAWLAATQYIAPLMANFDTSLNNDSAVKYVDNGTAFIVQWENVVLQENPQEGSFTFQCTLHDTGDIVFAYKNVPHFIDRIEENQHPVKVGLSDAYIIDKTIFFVRRKTIYEYHRVDFKRTDIRNGTAIILTALDTCLDLKDCQSCVTELPRFQCNWCSGRCSNGMDRHRHDWLQRGCEVAKLHTVETCPISYEPPQAKINYETQDAESVSIAGIVLIFLSLILIMGGGVWLVYAYQNPHTPSGQFLIRFAPGNKYRPSTWTWLRGEARYTAATIHM